jgi:hypothetical protein
VWKKNDGWWNKTNTERFSWCEKGHAAKTNYIVPTEYDGKFLHNKKSFYFGIVSSVFCEHYVNFGLFTGRGIFTAFEVRALASCSKDSVFDSPLS